MIRLEGIVPPVVTPLTAEERVDEAGLRQQLGRMLDAGVHAVYFLGSTGEQPALREAERRRAIRIAREVVGGRVPLVVGTMASSTAHALDSIAIAELEGADAVAVTPPYYYPSQGPAEQLAHYQTCAAAANGPVVIYNIPQTTKVMLSPDTISEIATIPNVIGLKDSSNDFSHFLRILDYQGPGDEFYCLIGSATMIGPAVLFGGDGAVPGIANVDPALCVRLYNAAREGDLDQTRFLQCRLASLFRIVGFGPPIVCLKTALELMGVCRAHACAPLQPLPPTARDQIAAILREHELL